LPGDPSSYANSYKRTPPLLINTGNFILSFLHCPEEFLAYIAGAEEVIIYEPIKLISIE